MKKFLFFMLLTSTLFTNPKGESVVHGEALFSRDESSLIITQNSEKSIINWEDFSISKGELTRFIQPENGSSLNRVICENPSLIYGNLQANGKIYLINKTGILVGESAVIDTRSFLASTLDVKDDDFLSGEGLNFFGNEGVFENEGILESFGDITIIAKEIKNSGSLTSKEGDVDLIATTEIFLKGKEIVIKPDCQGYLSNSGKIKAISSRLISSGNLNELAINHDGIIEANSIKDKGGEILLKSEKGEVRVTGTLKASKENEGGTIHILGEYVSLCGDAVLDVSSDFNAGILLVGGDYRGENEKIPNSKGVFVGGNVSVFADSRIDGNGGKVIFWGDDKNHFYGTVFARGGKEKGDGGFVEVSSKGDWKYGGNVLTLAENGKAGMLLFDPCNVDIDDYGEVSNPAFPGGPPPFTYPPSNPSGTATLDILNLSNALNSGNVTVVTNTGYTGGVGDVIFTASGAIKALNWNAPTTLAIVADRDIIMQSGSSITNSYSSPTKVFLDLSAGRDLYLRDITLGGKFNFEIGTNGGGVFAQAIGTTTSCASGNLAGSLNNDTFQFYGAVLGSFDVSVPGGNNTFNVNGTNINGEVSSGVGNDVYNLNSGSVKSVTVSGGTNTYNVNGGNVTNLTCGSSVDNFNLNSGSVGAVSGTSGSNVFTVNGGTLTTLNGGLGNETVNMNGGTVTTMYGNSGENIFNLSGGSILETLFGGNMSDIFNLNDPAVIYAINGGEGNNTLFGPNAPTSWFITGNNSGTVDNKPFENIQNLIGGTQADTFTFVERVAWVDGKVDGGDSTNVNTLDYSDYDTPVNVDLDNGTATGTGSIARIQKFILPEKYPIFLSDFIRLYVTEIVMASDLRDDNRTYYYFSWPIRVWRIEEGIEKLTLIYFYDFFRKETKKKNLLMR
jgi:filamentous hemagglutinin family protein